MEFLNTLHAHMRWLIMLWLIVAIARSLWGWNRGAPSGAFDRVLISGFLGLFGLQAVLGLVLLTTGITASRAEHAVTMIVALAIAHLMLRWRKLDAAARHRNNAVTLLVVLALVWAGVARYLGWGWLMGTGM